MGKRKRNYTARAMEAARWFQRDGHNAMPYAVSARFKVDLGTAEWILKLRTDAYGPGGKGEVWFARLLTELLPAD